MYYIRKIQRRKCMKPRVFISSTFYDLKYIREDLSNFIKAHDFEPIMFEEGDIGYTPGKPLDESCYKTMHSADMVLLIIGGNYGSPATGEIKESFREYMSVTRNEFKVAVDEGIPIYVFIDNKVYVEYDIYEANIESIEDQSSIINFRNVKDINVFRFIKEIKNIGNIAITEFDKISQIKDFLSKQWSDMFKKYLDILKNENTNEKLISAVDEMKILIKRMNTMINGIGERVLDGRQEIKYSDVMNEIEIEQICDLLSANLRTGEFVKDDRRKNVELYLEAVNEVVEKKEWDNHNEFHRVYNQALNKRGAHSSASSSPILENIGILEKLGDKDIYNAVKEKLLQSQYYDLVFTPNFPAKTKN